MQIGLSTLLQTLSQRVGWGNVAPRLDIPGQREHFSLWHFLSDAAARLNSILNPRSSKRALPERVSDGPQRGVDSGVFRRVALTEGVGGLVLQVPAEASVTRPASRIYQAQSSRGPVVLKEFLRSEGVANDTAENGVIAGRANHELEVMQYLNQRSIQGVPQVYGLTETPNSRNPLLAMQYIPGNSLQDILDGNVKRRFNTGDLINIAYKVLVVLQKMESAGIVHNDLKPSNVILTPAGDVYVIDFGSAQWVDNLERGDGVRTFGTGGYVLDNGTSATTPEDAQRRNLLNIAQLLYAFLGDGKPSNFIDGECAVGVINPLHSSRPSLSPAIVTLVHGMLDLRQPPPSLSHVVSIFASERSLIEKIRSLAA